MKRPKKDINQAIKDAKDIKFTMVWQDENSLWRPCKDIRNCPFYCLDVRDLNNISHKPELDKLKDYWRERQQLMP